MPYISVSNGLLVASFLPRPWSSDILTGNLNRKTIYLFNGRVPQTNKTLTEAINAAEPQIVWTVPYVLKLLAETGEGIDTLRACQVVSSSGSHCPDELGDMLTEKGVFLGCLFGS